MILWTNMQKRRAVSTQCETLLEKELRAKSKLMTRRRSAILTLPVLSYYS